MLPKTMSRVELMSELHAVAGRQAAIGLRTGHTVCGIVRLLPANGTRFVRVAGADGPYTFAVELVDSVEPVVNPCDCDH